MCGIFGWQFKQDRVPMRDKRMVLATILGDRNDNRGGKSWGWCATPTTQRTTFAISRGLDLIVSQAPAMATFSSLMGHTRQPTLGAVTKENAHPFEIGNIVGAHNGMVSNWKELEDKYPERKKFAVDSMHIFAHLNEGKDTKEISCYGAIEWVERTTAPASILLCKLSEGGDLSIARAEHGIVWSSSKTHLEDAMSAAELAISEFVRVKQGHVIDIHDGEAWKTNREIETSTYYRASYAATSGGHGHSYYDNEYTGWWETNLDKDSKVSADECENPMCGSPLDVEGDCLIMFDEKCTGAAARIVNGGKAAISVLSKTNSLSQPPSCKEVMDDPIVKTQCQALCTMCKVGNERDGSGWHSGMVDGLQKVTRMCQGPEHHAASLYVRTIALYKTKAGTVEDALRARFQLVKKTWGWVVCDDAKPWTLADFYKTLKSMECRFCHNLKLEANKKGLCESCQKRLEAKDLSLCGEEGCLATTPGASPFCSRHKCTEAGCNSQTCANSVYCAACREKRSSTSNVVQLEISTGPVPDTKQNGAAS